MIERAVSLTVTREVALVRATAAGTPKAWGTLAAAGVVAFKELAGRPATEEERRAVWAGLWQAVEAVSRAG
ncbi:MAG: hypothetical protein M3Z65_08205 [Chloroflexota bacterium]|nr:hypothetical protein [Chloroflexota bacterium]